LWCTHTRSRLQCYPLGTSKRGACCRIISNRLDKIWKTDCLSCSNTRLSLSKLSQFLGLAGPRTDGKQVRFAPPPILRLGHLKLRNVGNPVSNSKTSSRDIPTRKRKRKVSRMHKSEIVTQNAKCCLGKRVEVSCQSLPPLRAQGSARQRTCLAIDSQERSP